MTEKFIRTKTKASGGVTEEELAKMKILSEEWVAIAMRTDPIEPEKIIPALKGIMKVSGLKEPRVIIVRSPLEMAIRFGIEVHNPGWERSSPEDMSVGVVQRYRDEAIAVAGKQAIKTAREWHTVYQGGNMWAGSECYIVAGRDILGLDLPEHAKYAPWEQAARHGSFRIMYEDVCIVSDFPEKIEKDDQNRPHCADGPSHRWRDGWELFYWHGQEVPREWIMEKNTIDPATVLTHPNVETRRAGIEILGWERILKATNAKVVEVDDDPYVGEVLEVDLPGDEEEPTIKAHFLRALCGTGRVICEAFPLEEIDTDTKYSLPWRAQAWREDVPAREWLKPEVRT